MNRTLIQQYESYVAGVADSQPLFALIARATDEELTLLEKHIKTERQLRRFTTAMGAHPAPVKIRTKSKSKPVAMERAVWFEFLGDVPDFCGACGSRLFIDLFYPNRGAYDTKTGQKVAFGYLVGFICRQCRWAPIFEDGKSGIRYHADNIPAPVNWQEDSRHRRTYERKTDRYLDDYNYVGKVVWSERPNE